MRPDIWDRPTSGAGAASYAVTYNTSQLTVTGSASTQGLITQLFGVNTIPVSSTGVAQKNHVQIMLVLDCSGSMGPSLANMKTAANSFLSFFTPDQSEDWMGLVTFATAATVKVPLETNFATSIQASINSATANGRTNTADAIAQAGAQIPIQTGIPNADWKRQFIVFMTDGDPTAFTSTFVHANTSYNAVVSAAPNASGSNQWYDVDTDLSDPTTGQALSVNAVQTGLGTERDHLQDRHGHVCLLDKLGDAVRRVCAAKPLYCPGLLRHPPGYSRAAHSALGVHPHDGRNYGHRQCRVVESERDIDLHNRAPG